MAEIAPRSVESPVGVTIVLATLNEAENLPPLVARLLAANPPPFEVLVVDDGSTDGTREYVRGLARSDQRFHLLEHDGKQTTVRAQAQGIAGAQGRFIVIMDADLQHPPELVPSLVRALDAGDTLVVASRYVKGGSPGPRTWDRWLYSRGAELLARWFAPNARRLKDPMSGYFAFRREIFQPLAPEDRGFKLLLFVLAMLPDGRVSEIGYQFSPRASGKSKLTEGPSFIRMFLKEITLARRIRRDRIHRPST